MTESRAVSVVLAVGMLLAGAIALLAFGPLAVNVLLTVVVSALLLERTSIFRRVDLVWEDTDKALVNSAAAVETVEELRRLFVDQARGSWYCARCDLRKSTDGNSIKELNEHRRLVHGERVGAREPEPNPQTDPIGMPAQGPATEEAVEVAARQVRQLMEDGGMEERVVTIGGVQRTYRVRVERDAA